MPKDPTELSAVVAACERVRIGAECHGAVLALLDQPTVMWPPCCGSMCDPCNAKLKLAARLALKQLGRKPKE